MLLPSGTCLVRTIVAQLGCPVHFAFLHRARDVGLHDPASFGDVRRAHYMASQPGSLLTLYYRGGGRRDLTKGVGNLHPA